MKLKLVEKRILACEERLKKLRQDKDNILAETLLFCAGCGREFRIKEATFIQTHYYVPPHGCMGGDYWEEAEAQTDCPHCKARLRLYTNPEVVKLKRLFKKVEDEHKR